MGNPVPAGEALDFTLNTETGEEETDLCQALIEIKRDAEKKGFRFEIYADRLERHKA